MGIFVKTRMSTIYEIGSLVEKMCLAYEKEIDTLETTKFAFSTCIKEFIDKKDDLQDVTKCVATIKQLHKEMEIKRQNAIGARDCLKTLVTNIKALYDIEASKRKGATHAKNAG